MYKPKLRYSFCVMRLRSLWSQLSLIKYLNSFEIIPYLSWDKQYIETARKIKKSGIIYKQRRAGDGQLDYDVVFSESSGASKFEKRTLKDSKEHGKITIKLNNSISINKEIINTFYTPEKTKDTLHGMYLKGQRTINHFKKFIEKRLFLINGGDPDWDEFNTDIFKDQVQTIKKKYGKFILIGLPLLYEEERTWCRQILIQANKKNINVVIHIHPELEYRTQKILPKSIQKYIDFNTPRYTLFAASSFAVTHITSSLIAECLYLGKRVGCSPSIAHFVSYGMPHVWIDDYKKWSLHIIPKIGKYIYKKVPRINTSKEIDKFLSSENPFMNQNEVDSLFGWKRVPSYCSHLFEQVEKTIEELK